MRMEPHRDRKKKQSSAYFLGVLDRVTVTPLSDDFAANGPPLNRTEYIRLRGITMSLHANCNVVAVGVQ